MSGNRTPILGRSTRTLFRSALILASAQLLAGMAAADWFQGFETDIAGWDEFGGQYDAIRVASGTNGVTSHTGSYHALAAQADLDVDGGSAFTRFGGATAVFPTGGFYTEVYVYFDLASGSPNDTRFDWSTAAANTAGLHRRDFVFNGGYYDDTDATGSGPRIVMSASNNAGRGSSYPKNPGRDPYALTSSGWYRFRHTFYDSGAGVLAVDLTVADTGGSTLHSWTLSDPSDIIGTTVGGWRYGWFAASEFEALAFDDSREVNAVPEPASLAALGLGAVALLKRRKR